MIKQAVRVQSYKRVEEKKRVSVPQVVVAGARLYQLSHAAHLISHLDARELTNYTTRVDSRRCLMFM